MQQNLLRRIQKQYALRRVLHIRQRLVQRSAASRRAFARNLHAPFFRPYQKHARRFQLHNPCAEIGRCNPAECEKPMCHVIASFERAPNGKRTQVILINESLGY